MFAKQRGECSTKQLARRLPGRRCSAKAQSTQRAAALVLPLLAYKAAATLQGVRLQWYLELDASIALATAALLVFGSRVFFKHDFFF